MDKNNCMDTPSKKMRRLDARLPSLILSGGARGVMVIVVGNAHGDTSSNPGRD